MEGRVAVKELRLLPAESQPLPAEWLHWLLPVPLELLVVAGW
jgi:hypothetical protein